VSRPRFIYFGLALLLLAAAAAASLCCGGSRSAPPEQSGAVDGPEGKPRNREGSTWPEGSERSAGPGQAAGGCQAGPVLVVVRRRSLDGGGRERTITVHDGGAYVIDTGGRTQQGCVSSADLGLLKQQVQAADFAPQPPPEVACMAMPTRETTVEHPPTQRSAKFASPCGNPPHRSIGELVGSVERAVSGR
jgi:hypothetical protein